MIYASVCSGVEAASLAWIPLGWKPAWFSEIKPFPCAVLKHRFPEVPNLGDMTKIKVETIEDETGKTGKLQRFKNDGADVVVPGGVDLLVGGTPCQGFSVAGKQDGLDDPRSALCLAYCELLETMRPRWFVWENVPGVFSANQGDDFRTFLRKIDEIGYSVAWRVLDAQYVRVDGYPRAIPQRRRRVFVVGHLGSDFRCPAEVLFEPEIVFRTTPPRRSKVSGVARCLTASTGGASGKEQQNAFVICNSVPDVLCVHGSQDPVTQHELAHAAGRNNGRENCVVYENHPQDAFVRRLLPVEYERLMGFPDNWTRIPWRSKPEEECPDSHRYNACGNSMCVNVMRWIGMRIDWFRSHKQGGLKDD